MAYTDPAIAPAATLTPTLRDYQLKDNIWAPQGAVFLSGTQALVRLMLMQRQHDERQQWNTRGFISGYRGSPLGNYDQALWSARKHLQAQQIVFQPGAAVVESF